MARTTLKVKNAVGSKVKLKADKSREIEIFQVDDSNTTEAWVEQIRSKVGDSSEVVALNSHVIAVVKGYGFINTPESCDALIQALQALKAKL